MRNRLSGTGLSICYGPEKNHLEYYTLSRWIYLYETPSESLSYFQRNNSEVNKIGKYFKYFWITETGRACHWIFIWIDKLSRIKPATLIYKALVRVA